ncbi:MAG TPA: hypothetical protein DFR83_05950, partial [Deltaproteobacteria bacterium]|nr:hypothetical protein [Deltaproteobacteria bacterium]
GLSPSSGATKTDTLTCTATVADDDDDSLSTTFAWTVEGSGVAASSTSGLTSTLAGAFVAGEEAICTATTDDGKGGTDGASASTTITNIAPTVSAVTLDKSVVYTNDTLTASVASSDMDGDSLTITYDWYVEGSSVQDGASDTLSGASSSVGFDKDEEVYVVVSVTDGTDMTTSTSSTLTVSNTPPEAPVLTIDPSDPFTGEDLFCEVTSESFDADGDTVTYSMAWNDDSGAYSGAITDVWTDDTVDGVDTAGGEVWECTATPNDGDEDGSTASESVSVWGLCDDGTVALTASSVDFVSVCTGIFDVGCTPGQSSCTSDESPVMPVTLDREFYISQTEVTQEQYEDLMGSNPATFSSCGSDCPVETTSWHMAAAFANAMSVANDLNECYECTGSGSSTSCSHAMDPYTCDGYRLPTEAEWEVAARCGEDYLYAGSNTASAVSVYGVSSTVAVGTKSANDCGLYDMSGNVYEWVDDWYSGSYYLAAGRTAPTGPSSGSGRVIRGGSALNTVASMRTSDRFFTSPGTRASYLGFRLARTVDGDYDGDGYLLSEDCDDTDRSAWEDPDCDPDIIAVFPKVSSWPNAQADCLSRGAHLVWIESADVNSQVLDLCNSSPDVGEQTCSIGLQSPYTAWENGDAVTYTNWDTGTFDGSGIYAMMYNSQYLGASSAIGEWDDAYPTNKPYICRFANGIGDYTGADNTAEVR